MAIHMPTRIGPKIAKGPGEAHRYTPNINVMGKSPAAPKYTNWAGSGISIGIRTHVWAIIVHIDR